jgi:ABC-type phosphate transport system substrate-binding protein
MFTKIATITLLSVTTFIASAELTVIVNPANTAALDAKKVQRIFLGKEKKFSDGTETLPVNQNVDSVIRADFDNNLLGRSSSQVAAYWSKLVFTGKGIPPKEVTNDAEVVDLVAKNPNVIGYVDSSSVNDTVKVVSL